MKSVLQFSNAIRVELDIRDNRYCGISGAFLEDVAFVVSGRGNVPYFQTPDGISYQEFIPLDWKEENDAFILELEAIGRCAPIQSDLDLFGFPRISTAKGEVRDRLNIWFAAQSQTVGGEEYMGFAVSYEWKSESRQIHWLYESIALAPEGTTIGARLMAQNMTQNLNPLESVLTSETIYSTQEHYDRSCIESPCRGGGSQIFDLVQGKNLAVVNFFAEPTGEGNALKTNCQTMPGEDFVTVSDFHYGALASEFRTAPRVVLALKKTEASRTSDINRWTAWFDFTAELWCEKLGITRTQVVPTLTFEGTGAGGIDIGMAYPDLLKVWTERLDWVVEQGFRAINLHTPEYVSAANRKTLVFGGNNCCPWEYKLSDQLGGDAGLKAFCEACHAKGVKVYIWIAGHLHREAPIWREHPEWMVRSADHRLWDGHYGVIHTLSFAEESMRDWFLQDMKHLREVTGVDGIWFDSFTNLTLGAINWQRPDRVSNAPGVFRFLADLHNLGYEIMIESMSQLGVSSWGNLPPAKITGQEELLLNSNMRYYMRLWKSDPAITEKLYFRCLAAKAPLGVWIEEFLGHAEPFPAELPEWFGPLTSAFADAVDSMHSRHLLEEGALWKDHTGKDAVFFAFTSGEVPSALRGSLFETTPAANTVSTLKEGKIYKVR